MTGCLQDSSCDGRSPSSCTPRSRKAVRRRAQVILARRPMGYPALLRQHDQRASVGSPMSLAPSSEASAVSSAMATKAGRRSRPGLAHRLDRPLRRRSPAIHHVTIAHDDRSSTVIWLSVSVPVLSEQMAEVEPSVSTEVRRLTMALAFGELALCPWPALSSPPRADLWDGGDGHGDAGDEQQAEGLPAAGRCRS